MIIRIPPDFDSKFRFINVAAQRARQIQAGSFPKIARGTKPATIAIREAEDNLISYKIVEIKS